jgi:hypothetical protein
MMVEETKQVFDIGTNVVIKATGCEGMTCPAIGLCGTVLRDSAGGSSKLIRLKSELRCTTSREGMRTSCWFSNTALKLAESSVKVPLKRNDSVRIKATGCSGTTCPEIGSIGVIDSPIVDGRVDVKFVNHSSCGGSACRFNEKDLELVTKVDVDHAKDVEIAGLKETNDALERTVKALSDFGKKFEEIGWGVTTLKPIRNTYGVLWEFTVTAIARNTKVPDADEFKVFRRRVSP